HSVLLQDRLLGNKSPLPAYIAIKDGRPSAVILQAIAPDGYSGAIHLLVGIWADGRVAGVRVLGHRETPGLGDRIELTKSPWIRSFDGKSLENPQADGWAVKKDRGTFDQFAGATITPRAVVGAVHRALQYFDVHKAELLTADAGTTQHPDPLAGDDEPAEATTHSRAGDAATRDTLRMSEPEVKPEGDQP
ncbi:electron transport complex subunit RsxG, partial [Pseudomonas sp.]|uniref:electron transport complex subunit RsxG n=1 Tax=Pseudomonas sp. TaxID=306 RepID=UPI003D10D2AF